MSSNVLLTGGRAPVTLDLARLFAAAGDRVFVADSMQHQLCSLSRYVCGNFFVPTPRFNYQAYIQALIEIIQAEKIDLLIPTCEEIFYISHALSQLTRYCRVFAESLEQLNLLHNKWEFIQLAQKRGLKVPATWFLKTNHDLEIVINCVEQKIILKPVYSRFASHIHILNPPFDNLPNILINSQRTWVAQEFITGQHYSSYSVVIHGKITAHAVYPSLFTAGKGACIYFESIIHPSILAWVTNFLAGTDFTGQISFDWIENQDGEIYAIESNPRTISAVHLFTPRDNFHRAFFQNLDNPSEGIIQPQPQQRAMISMAMLIYGLPTAISTKQVREWLKIFLKTPDVIFRLDDPFPFLSIWIILFKTLLISWKTKLTLQQVSTQDIEWDGEEIGQGEILKL